MDRLFKSALIKIRSKISLDSQFNFLFQKENRNRSTAAFYNLAFIHHTYWLTDSLKNLNHKNYSCSWSWVSIFNLNGRTKRRDSRAAGIYFYFIHELESLFLTVDLKVSWFGSDPPFFKNRRSFTCESTPVFSVKFSGSIIFILRFPSSAGHQLP